MLFYKVKNPVTITGIKCPHTWKVKINKMSKYLTIPVTFTIKINVILFSLRYINK